MQLDVEVADAASPQTPSEYSWHGIIWDREYIIKVFLCLLGPGNPEPDVSQPVGPAHVSCVAKRASNSSI